MKKPHMTSPLATGASSASTSPWDSINWPRMEREVRRLQERIAKAVRNGHHHRAKALQWLLTHSQAAKLLAVKRVTSNAGRKTPGVDGVKWTTPKQKWQAVMSLKRRSYRAQPLRRIYIPKKNGKQRPLGIPTMQCRAVQALHLLGLQPIAETTADPNSYGFRPFRSTADTIEQCFILLAKRNAPQWILEGDIKACFDRIDHSWLRANIPMDKTILEQWLNAGYCEQGQWFPTDEGTPQGGIASPTLANMALDGLQQAIAEAVPKGHKVNFVRYADDFIVTGDSRDILESLIKPAIERFLQPRGLELSPEKTLVSHIDDGFDFLGFNIRKYDGKLLIKPAKKNVNAFLDKTREIIKSHPTAKAINLIRLLNPVIKGWANYYRHVVASKCFNTVDYELGKAIWRWVERRHPKKSSQWKQARYYCRVRGDNWRFSAPTQVKDMPARLLLAKARGVTIQRHTKIRAYANPFDPEYRAYFAARSKKQSTRTTGSLRGLGKA
jgi:RNA-directed DNA polymerase